MKLKAMTIGEILFYLVVGFSLAIILGSLLPSKVSAQTVTATGTATLSWTAPTTYVDGSPLALSDIQKFTIYYGTEEGVYTDSVDIEGGQLSSVIELTITEDTRFYFAATAWANDLESEFSNSASKLLEFTSGAVAPGAPQIIDLSFTAECVDLRPGYVCQVVIE